MSPPLDLDNANDDDPFFEAELELSTNRLCMLRQEACEPSPLDALSSKATSYKKTLGSCVSWNALRAGRVVLLAHQDEMIPSLEKAFSSTLYFRYELCRQSAKRCEPQAHTGPTERKNHHQKPMWTIVDKGLDKRSRFLERRSSLTQLGPYYS